ncbi:MAG: YfcE family phosphodiesterase [Anaerolineae bacterium]|nr:YfcE family phosphodiesterase [Anaerolineae bacterium]
MKIALIADTHGEQQRIQTALDRFRREAVDTLFHAGDVADSATLRLFAGFDVWIARGNMDRDPGLPAAVRELFGAGRLVVEHILSVDGVKIAVVHGDNSARLEALIRSGEYRYVVHGHTHARKDERVGLTRVINPGALSHPRGFAATCAILDLDADRLEWIEV